MKKIICLILVLLFTISLFGCNFDDTEKPSNNSGTAGTEQPIKPTEQDGEKEDKNEDIEEDIKEDGIIAIYPKQNKFLFLSNNMMTRWLKNYTYGSSESFVFEPNDKIEEINDFNDSITLSWTDTFDCDYYLLAFDNKKEMSTASKYYVTTREYEISNLNVATDYYWRVIGYKNGEKQVVSELFHFTTASTPKTIELEGVINSRDAGGYYTTFGKRVKTGLMYRCAATEDVTALGKKQATEIYGIKTEIDLRGGPLHPDEDYIIENHLANGSSFGKEVAYKNFCTPDYYIETKNSADMIIKVIKEFAKEENYPLVFHCVGGRDRTGTVACIINSLLGVEEEDLRIDYETTFFVTKDRVFNKNSYAPLFEALLATLKSFEGETLAEKTANYLITNGMTQEEIDSIRNILLEK